MPTFSQRHVLLLASYIIIFGGLLLVLPLKLLPSLLAGLLVYELVNMLTPQLQRLIEGRRARWLAVALLGTLIVSVLALIFAGAISFLLHEAENPGASLDKFMGVVDRARGQLPPFLDAYLPASAAEFRVAIGELAEQTPERAATGGQRRRAHVRHPADRHGARRDHRPAARA